MTTSKYVMYIQKKITDVKVVFTGSLRADDGSAQPIPALAEMMLLVKDQVEDEKVYENIAKDLIGEATQETHPDAAYKIEYVTDENPSTIWNSKWTSNYISLYPCTFTLPLNETTYVDYVEVYLEKVGLPYQFHVDVVLADDTTLTVIDKRDNTSTLSDKLFTADINREIKAVKVIYDNTTQQGSASQASPALAEIKVMKEKVVTQASNVAPNANISCTIETAADSNLNLTVDNSTSTFWKSVWADNIDQFYPAIITYNLEYVTNVEYVEVYLEKTGLPYKFHVEVVDKDGNTTTIIDKTDNTSTLSEVNFKAEVNKEIAKVNVVFDGTTKQGSYAKATPALAECYIVGTVNEDAMSDKTVALRARINEIKTAIDALSYGDTYGKYKASAKAQLSADLTLIEEQITTSLTYDEAAALLKQVNAAYENFNVNGKVYINRFDLLKTLSEAENMIKYHDASNLETVYNTALQVYRTYATTQTAIDEAYAALKTLVDATEVVVDKEALQTLYDESANKEASEYTSESFAMYTNAITNADAILKDSNATQFSVDEAYNALFKAVNSLQKEGEGANKAALQALYDANSNLDSRGYTSATWAYFEGIMATTLEILNDENATQVQVNNAYDDLVKAIAQLVEQEIIPDVDESLLINTEANKTLVQVIGYSSQADGTGGASEGDGLGTAAATLDYNNNTYWHSNYKTNVGSQHYVSYKLDQVYDLVEVRFLPRQGSINGDIFEVNVYVSDDEIFELS